MAFKALNINLARAYDEIRREAARSYSEAVTLRAASLAGSISSAQILGLAGNLRSARIIMEERSSTPGIASYAQAQEDDAAYNVAAEYVTMRDTLDATLAWISSAMPENGGYLQAETLNADGSVTYRSFSTAQTAGLRSALDNLIASIE